MNALGALRRPVVAIPVAVLLAGLVVGLDRIIPSAGSYARLGVLDEAAHLASTALVLLAVVTSRGAAVPRGFAVGALVAGNLIDVDHVPVVLGSDLLTRGSERPYTHSLVTCAVLLLLAMSDRRLYQVCSGAALGVAVHLLRDTSTSTAPLTWPLSYESWSLGPWPYLVVVAGSVVTVTVGSLRRADRDPCAGPRAGTAAGAARSDRTGAATAGRAEGTTRR